MRSGLATLLYLLRFRLLPEFLQFFDRVENFRNVSLAQKLREIMGVNLDFLEEVFFPHAVNDSENCRQAQDCAGARKSYGT